MAINPIGINTGKNRILFTVLIIMTFTISPSGRAQVMPIMPSEKVSPSAPMAEPQQRKAKPLTNGDVIAMIQAGLSESTIVMAIKQSAAEFDTAPLALVELKKQGATAGILEAMMQVQSGVAAPVKKGTGNPFLDAYAEAQASETATSSMVRTEQNTVTLGMAWLEQNDKKIPIRASNGRIDPSMGQIVKEILLFSPTSKYALVIDGSKSKTRLSGPPTAICIRTAPTMVGGTGLVRLNAEEDSRFATIVSKAWSSLRKFYPAECEIKGDVEYLDNNLQKITFMNPLAPGEYGFVVNGVMIYDFAID